MPGFTETISPLLQTLDGQGMMASQMNADFIYGIQLIEVSISAVRAKKS